jgi:hypothetical protein
VTYSRESLFLSQRKYVLELLEEIRMIGYKPVSTPMDSKNKLNIEDGEPLGDISQYQRLVEKLIYLTVTRPDLAFTVSKISQFMHSPRSSHLEAINRILRYLKGAPGKGIFMKNNNSNKICGYTDANWVGSFDRKFTTGYCTFVGGNLAIWKSKKQNIVARSSVEAEYRAMESTTSELTWIKQLLIDMHFTTNSPMKLFCDNQAARHIASNLVFHERTKHKKFDCHFIHEKIQAKEIETPFVKSEDQLADVLTKSLEPTPFEANILKLGLIDIYNPNLRGSVKNKYYKLELYKWVSDTCHHRPIIAIRGLPFLLSFITVTVPLVQSI